MKKTLSISALLFSTTAFSAAPTSPFPADQTTADKIVKACEKANDSEMCLKKQGVNVFERKNKGHDLVVYTTNGKAFTFKDEGESNDDGTFYSYREYVPSHHFHIINVQTPGESYNVLLSDNGKKIETSSFHLSPTKELGYSINIEANPSVKIYDLNTLQSIWQSPLHNKMPTYTDRGQWLKDGSLQFTWMCTGEKTVNTRFLKQNGKWVMDGKICASNG